MVVDSMEVDSIGVDIGGTSIKLARLHGRRIGEVVELETPVEESPKEVLDSLALAVVRLSGAGRRERPPPVGVAVPGFLDEQRAKVVRLSNLPALDGVRLKAELRKRLGGKVVLDTDTNAALSAEVHLGAGRGFDRVLYLTLGTGLGAALAVRGEPVRVSHHTIGQVAHIPLSASGPRCYCGSRGCAETLLSARGVLWRAGRAGIRGIASPKDLWGLGRSRSSPGLKARGQRSKALQVWMETGELLGGLLRILAALFSPELVVLGGGISGAARFFLPHARGYLNRFHAPLLRGKVLLRPAELGRHAGSVGAALLARDSGSSKAP
jgi:glucokinase